MNKINNPLLVFAEQSIRDLKVDAQECPKCEKPFVPTPKSKDMCIPCKFKKDKRSK